MTYKESLMLTRTKGHRCHLNRTAVRPVSALKFRTIHPDEGTVAVVGM